MDLVLPYLHMTWLRVHGLERPPATLPASAATPRSLPLQRAPITERERQILSWVREGKSNLQIGELLGISPLTVKNHVQKVLRKLGAANRAQAVAQAMVLNLLDGRNPPH
jgi:DNA-binding CsgD family transcriptional regulator